MSDVVTARPYPGTEWDGTEFEDITPLAVIEMAWLPDAVRLGIRFAGDLSDVEATAIRLRLTSRDADEEALRRQGITALDNNATYLAIAAPTNVQVRDQTRALTQQVNALIRLALKT